MNMNHSFRLLAVTFVFLLTLMHSHAAQSAPHADAKEDHNVCVKKGFFLGKQEDPATENYYNCRAEIAISHMIKPVLLKGRLSAEEDEHNKLMEKVAKNFSEKALAARDYRLNGSEILLRQWEQQQSDDAKHFDAADHKHCIATGLEPSVWGSPDTEKYYLCRASVIERRALAKPFVAKNNEKKLPRAALFFYNKAREAAYAFSAVDNETHKTCLSKGIYPGDWEDPKTQQYYDCRAALAEANMGRKVTAIFRARASQAAEAAADNQPCINKGFQKGTASYQKCRKAILVYKQCLNEIGGKLSVQKRQDATDCFEDAKLRFPGHGKKASESRSKAYGICLRQRETVRMQAQAANLKMNCADILDFNKPR